MTIFDLIALAIVGWSAFSGFNKGAAAELLGLFAMALSAMATIAFLPAVAPMVRHVLHAGWMSAVAAALLIFVVVFLFLRLVAATLTQSLNRSILGGVNRFGGLVFGALRGLVLLGLFALLFNRVTPERLKPDWITDAAAYPIAGSVGRALSGVLPNRPDFAGGFGSTLTNTITREGARSEDEAAPTETGPISETVNAEPEIGGEPQPNPVVRPALSPAPSEAAGNPPASERVKRREHGYTRRARDGLDALVERSR